MASLALAAGLANAYPAQMGMKARSTKGSSEVEVFLARIRALYARVWMAGWTSRIGALGFTREEVPFGLNSGATRANINKYQRVSKQPISDTLEELWRTTNGTRLPILTRGLGWLSSYSLMSLEESLARRAITERYQGNYRDYVEPKPRDPRIRPGWYHTGWVPFASYCDAVYFMEDHAPQPGGTVGQIIQFTHDPDEIVWIANSLAELLPTSVAQLESDPEEYGIEW